MVHNLVLPLIPAAVTMAVGGAILLYVLGSLHENRRDIQQLAVAVLKMEVRRIKQGTGTSESLLECINDLQAFFVDDKDSQTFLMQMVSAVR